MECSRCGREQDGFHFDNWNKIRYNSLAPYQTTNGLTSLVDLYYLFCPWCFNEVFGDLKPLGSVTVQKVEEKEPIKMRIYETPGTVVHINGDGEWTVMRPGQN